MELQSFYGEFELIAEAPNGIQKLREMILQLAVQGKLVPQHSKDGSGLDIVNKNMEARDELVKTGAIKEPKKLPIIQESEIPFEIPGSWSWSRLGDITNYGYSEKINPTDIDGEVWVLELEDVEKVTSKLLKKVRFKDRGSKSTKNVFESGDVIYGKLRPYLDKVIVAHEDGVCTTEMIPVHGFYGLNPEYLRWTMKSPFFIDFANRSTHGMNLPRLGTDKARCSLVPIPPTDEQKRIVAKVDELMALCDDLEARKLKTHQTCIKLNDVSINKLLAAPTPQKLEKHWNRIHSNFDLLYSKAENVTKLRQAILQLAVQGKLVPQDPNDEPASVLLKKIKDTREALIKSGDIRKIKALPGLDLKDESLPKLPVGWAHCYIDDLAEKVTDGEHATPNRSDSGWYLLSARNVRNEGISLDNVDYVPEDEFLRIRKRCNPDKDDLLISCSGSVGRVAIVDKDNTYVMVRSAALVKPFKRHLDSRYLAYMLRSPYVQVQIVEKSKTSAQSNLFIGEIRALKAVLPPKEEQKLIVAKVDQLMALCDVLENKISQGQSDGSQLVEAVIADLLAA